jgi:hypothetical protein
MTLVACPGCGAQISDHAVACPHCGRPGAKIAARTSHAAKPGMQVGGPAGDHGQIRVPTKRPWLLYGYFCWSLAFGLFGLDILLAFFGTTGGLSEIPNRLLVLGGGVPLCIFGLLDEYYFRPGYTTVSAPWLAKIATALFCFGILAPLGGILIAVVLPTCSARPKTCTSLEGDIQLTLPAGWEECHEDQGVRLQASSPLEDLYVCVYSEQREDFSGMTLDKYAEIHQNLLVQELGPSDGTPPSVTPPKRIVLNNFPAVQCEIRASFNQVNLVFLQTVIETPTTYYQIRAWTTVSKYRSHAEELKAIVEQCQLKGI